MTRLRSIDPAMAVIALIAVAALALMSVASYEFFGYVLGVAPLALASTVVMAVGLPTLKVAARYAPSERAKRSYTLALVVLLGVELVAQYFKAQANFARQVALRPELAGSDLAAAAGDGLWSRLLAFTFLASMPFVVVLCVDALADRWPVVRSRASRRGLRRFAKVRARFAALRRSLASARGELANLRGMFATAEADLASARGELANLRGAFAESEAALASARGNLADTRNKLATARGRLAETDTMLANLRGELATAHGDLVTVRGHLASVRSELAVAARDRDEARGLAVQLRGELDRERHRPVLSVEAATSLLIEAGAPEATIRGWLTSGRLRAPEYVPADQGGG